MPFPKGQSGNPGGRKKSLGLSRALRKAAGTEGWAMAMKILRGEILEPYFDKETEKTIYLSPGARTRLEACKIILAYCWGQPTQKIDLDSEDGKVFGFAVLIHPEAEGMLNGDKRGVPTTVRPNGVSFDFGNKPRSGA